MIFSTPNKEGTTWGEIEKLSPEQHKNKIYTIIGFSLIASGFLLQLISAGINL